MPRTAPRATTAQETHRALPRVLDLYYGLHGTLQRLGGEQDENFLLSAESGGDFLVKVVRNAEDEQVVHLQSSVLDFLERTACDLPVPRIVASRDGALTTLVSDGELHGRWVRVTTFLAGRLLRTVTPTSQLRREIGQVSAKLTRALASFDDVARRRTMLWDLAQAESLWPLLDELGEHPEHQLLHHHLAHFVNDVLPVLEQLPRSVVHNDLSRDNLLLDASGHHLIGVLDFGDVIDTQRVNDVAIAATYQLKDSGEPTRPVIEVIAGYHSLSPLSPCEIRALPHLILGRLVMWNIIPRWRSLHAPENNAYVLRNAEWSWSLLLRWLDVPLESLAEELLTICSKVEE